MGEAKRKKAYSFSPAQIAAWEADDCVNFAIALARKTGWLLHVDWASESQDDPIEKMIPLRVYVGDNAEKIFDVYGVKGFEEFNDRTIKPLALKRFPSLYGVSTKFFSEEKLWRLPLRALPNEEKIKDAQKAIDEKPEYLKLIPTRQPPLIPAHEAAEFTFGNCAMYADALQAATGLKATAMLAKKFHPFFANTSMKQGGYVHSFVLHENGMAEDSWGVQTVGRIAERFGIADYTLSVDEHVKAINDMKKNSPIQFAKAYKMAEAAIKTFR